MNTGLLLIVMLILIHVLTLASSQYVEFYRNHQRPETNIDYSFRYFIDEPDGVSLDHWESKQLDGAVKGGYGVKDPDGNVRTVHYEVEDKSGFKAVIKIVSPGAFHYQRLWIGQPKTPYMHAEPVKIL